MFIAQRGLRCYLLGINRPDDKRDRRVLTRDRVIDERLTSGGRTGMRWTLAPSMYKEEGTSETEFMGSKRLQ